MTKQFWLGVLVMLLSLIGVNALSAFVMTTGLLDHHMMAPAACAAWVIGAFLGGRFAARGKTASIPSAVLVGAIVYVIVWLLSLLLSESGPVANMWWKSGLCALGGALAAGITAPRNRKKRGKGRGKQKVRKAR